MSRLLTLISLSLTALAAAVLAQDLVQIQFQTDPVLVQTGTDIVFTVLTVSEVLSVTWLYPGGDTPLGLWAGGTAVVNPVAQYQGRVTITATQLRIGGAQLRDAGNYTVEVNPSATTGLSSNSRSIQLRVFDAVAGVSLFVPSVSIEGGNISLSCTWTAGTDTSVQWGKGGSTISANSRITISAGSLVIDPARRGDAGEYTCTVSNPISARTATRSLTVYYGPDTPVLTKSAPVECVGGGDAVVGQTVRLTCVSDSLPPALFSWQHDGQPVASGQPDSGVLSIQTFSSNESGRYTCTARNSVTGGTSEQGTDVAVVGTCLSGGAVAGIVIGCVVALFLIILLIVLLVRWRRVDQRLRDSRGLLKTNPNPMLTVPDPQPHGTRNSGQGPDPRLHEIDTRVPNPPLFYSTSDGRNMNVLQPRSLQNSHTFQHNGSTHANELPHNAIQNPNSYPHNGVNNPVFTHAVPQRTNMLPHTQPQNPNILIQTGVGQGSSQHPTVHVNLNTLPQAAQEFNHNSGQLPTVHVNLNSYPTNDQPAHVDPADINTRPVSNTTNHSALQNGNQQNLIPTGRTYTNPRMQRMPSHSGNPHTGMSHEALSAFDRQTTGRQNANTQTYRQDNSLDSRSRRSRPTDPIPAQHDSLARSSTEQRQLPWDRLRGTPSYPNTMARRRPTTSSSTDNTDYITHPPLQQTGNAPRTEPDTRIQVVSRHTATAEQDIQAAGRWTRAQSSVSESQIQSQNTQRLTQPEAPRDSQGSRRAQRESSQDIQGLPQSQIAPRQAAVHRNTLQAMPLSNQPVSVSRVAPSAAPQSPDARAQADPNHLSQAIMTQEHRVAPIQMAQTQPGVHRAALPSRGVTSSVLHPSGLKNPSPNLNLTQAALQMHTQQAQVFRNRNEQTRAALVHSEPEAQAAVPRVQHPPTPPPVIPLAHFQSLPKAHTSHRSPTRGPQPPRHPINIPTTQRHTQVHQHISMQNRHTATHGNPHRHLGNAKNAETHQHAHARGHPAHVTHPHRAHRGRAR